MNTTNAMAAWNAVICALDVSGSMRERDRDVSRFDQMIEAFGQLLEVKRQTFPQELVAVVCFNHEAVIRHPGGIIATDAEALRGCMNQIEPGGNTAIGAGMELGQELRMQGFGLGRGKPRQTQMIVITDGKNNEPPDPVTVAAQLKDSGVWIDVVGIGNPEELDATCLKAIASRRPDGTPSYRYVGDRLALGAHLCQLAQHYLVPL